MLPRFITPISFMIFRFLLLYFRHHADAAPRRYFLLLRCRFILLIFSRQLAADIAAAYAALMPPALRYDCFRCHFHLHVYAAC